MTLIKYSIHLNNDLHLALTSKYSEYLILGFESIEYSSLANAIFSGL